MCKVELADTVSKTKRSLRSLSTALQRVFGQFIGVFARPELVCSGLV
jgi:hypothetical protein